MYLLCGKYYRSLLHHELLKVVVLLNFLNFLHPAVDFLEVPAEHLNIFVIIHHFKVALPELLLAFNLNVRVLALERLPRACEHVLLQYQAELLQALFEYQVNFLPKSPNYSAYFDGLR